MTIVVKKVPKCLRGFVKLKIKNKKDSERKYYVFIKFF